jgi:hypothetical protein
MRFGYENSGRGDREIQGLQGRVSRRKSVERSSSLAWSLK